MLNDFKNLESRVEEIALWLKSEYLGIQTGRSNPAVLDGVMVESYGSKVALNQVASVTSEGPRTLRVAVWDKSQLQEVEKSINNSELGISASSDDQGVRVFFPELTTEKREFLLKIVKNKHEEARVSLRQARDEVWGSIQSQEKEGEISEDEKFSQKDEMEKIISQGNKELDEITQRKEKDISA